VSYLKGTYVLQDNNFQLLTQMSDGKQYTEDAPKVFKNIVFWNEFSRLQYNC